MFIVFRIGNSNKNEYTFKKFKGSYNYKHWMQDMSFALEKAQLWRHIEKTIVAVFFFKAKINNSKY